MKVNNLTQDYITNILERDSLDLYKQSIPNLLKHYFDYWALEEYFHRSLKTEEEVKEKTDLILSRLDFIKEKINSFGFDTEDIEMSLFVGQNCSNGHAFKENGRFNVWLPVEAYESKEDIDTFVIHEIVHAFHYSVNPKFYFKTNEEKMNVGRQLITEGIATYLTSKILKVSDKKALWADLLDQKELRDWFSACEDKRRELFDHVLNNFSLSKEDIQIFWANDPSDIYKYRAGYFVGLEVIKEFVRKEKVSDIDIINIKRDILEEKVKGILGSHI